MSTFIQVVRENSSAFISIEPRLIEFNFEKEITRDGSNCTHCSHIIHVVYISFRVTLAQVADKWLSQVRNLGWGRYTRKHFRFPCFVPVCKESGVLTRFWTCYCTTCTGQNSEEMIDRVERSVSALPVPQFLHQLQSDGEAGKRLRQLAHQDVHEAASAASCGDGRGLLPGGRARRPPGGGAPSPREVAGAPRGAAPLQRPLVHGESLQLQLRGRLGCDEVGSTPQG